MLVDPKLTARQFWRLVGTEEPFPRNLQGAVSLALPLTIVYLPGLSPVSIERWLSQRGLCWSLRTGDRALRGCLVAHRGHGFLFTDGTMPADEARLTIAHETAHFLCHYLKPRQIAAQRLGPGIVAALDGDRQATLAERLNGVLRGVPLGRYMRLLERDAEGMPVGEAQEAETEADLVAFELIAPSTLVLATTQPGEARFRALVSKFGMPLWAARAWAGWLDSRARRDPLIEGLRAATDPG